MSSRPHTSIYLQEQADVRVDILGFTEADRKQYIQQALHGKPKMIQELSHFLDHHLVPFNMTILIFLYKAGVVLPKTSAHLYKHFIYITIRSNLAKSGHCMKNTSPSLENLPEPCNRIIKQLSIFSLQCLNGSKLIFTLDEIATACSDIVAIPEAINGYSLLQAMEHFGMTGKTMTFNFVHLSIQEFLAACHIAQIPPVDELKILSERFWKINHFNVFAFYETLTKGQRLSFKEFLSDGSATDVISDKFLTDQIKCFRLFQCFYEAGDVKALKNQKHLIS